MPPLESIEQQEQVKLAEVCSACGKPAYNKGSLTSWIFKEKKCACKIAKAIVEKTTALRTQAEEALPNLGERYEVIECIGKGGMGSVYKVQDRQIEKIFAIKVLNPSLLSDQSACRRFELEATAAVDMTHPNLVAVYGHGCTSDGAKYLIMDYVEGENLAQWLKHQERLLLATTLDIFEQVADALAHAHMKGIVHRDVKPANILLSQTESGAYVARVVDFGIAGLLPAANRETQNLTGVGEVFGSPSYMSPEQCMGFKTEPRSDIYALGCSLYEALTGNPPFVGDNPIQVIAQHLNEKPNWFPLRELAREPLEIAVLKCLEKDPNHRYQSMDELKIDLNRIRNGQKSNTKTLAHTGSAEDFLEIAIVLPFMVCYVTTSQ